MISGFGCAALALLFGYLALFFWGSAMAAQAAGKPVWLVTLKGNPQSPLWETRSRGSLTVSNRVGDFSVLRFEPGPPRRVSKLDIAFEKQLVKK